MAVTTPNPPTLPAAPRPVATWTVEYGNQLYRWLSALQNYYGGYPYLRGSGLFFVADSLPETGYGLVPGMVFSNAGVLTVVREDDIWVGSLSATGAIGTVTVTP